MNDGLGQPKPASDPLVAFDFDGTLTCRDSFVAFLSWRAQPDRLLAGLPGLASAGLSFAISRDRGALKAAVARHLLGDVDRTVLANEARRFAAERFEALMRPDAMACWRDWGARGAKRYIVTASPEILVAPFAEALGADGLIGTRLRFDASGRFCGRLDGPNCRGAQKVERLRAELGSGFRLTAAYGDTSGDREMLALAEQPSFRVFTAKGKSNPRSPVQ